MLLLCVRFPLPPASQPFSRAVCVLPRVQRKENLHQPTATAFVLKHAGLSVYLFALAVKKRSDWTVWTFLKQNWRQIRAKNLKAEGFFLFLFLF